MFEILIFVAVMPFSCFGNEMSVFEAKFGYTLANELKKICALNSYEGCDNRNISRSRVMPCCRECSCLADCELYDTCCFPKTDSTTQNYNEMHKDQDCLKLEFGDVFNLPQYTETHFYVTTRCPTSHVQSFTGDEDCGNVQVAMWGSLNPVYSPSQRKIYKNIECAKCHGITDTIASQHFFSCRHHNNESSTMDVSIEWIKTMKFPESCLLRFIFPIPGKELSKLTCYSARYIDYCQVPSDSLAYKKFNKACTSGFLSPVTEKNTRPFRNRFCAMCSYDPPQHYANCVLDHKIRIIKGSFSFVLNFKDSPERRNGLVGLKQRSPPIACRNIASHENKTEVCVKVLCPVGQLYDDNFQCFLPSSYLIVDSYATHLTLKLEYKIGSTQLKTNTWNFTSSWPKGWTIKDVFAYSDEFFFDQHSNVSVSSVLLHIAKRYQRRVPHISLLEEVSKHVNTPWTLTFSNFSINATASFSYYMLDNWPIVKIYIPEKESFGLMADIDRLQLCDRVALRKGEFTRTRYYIKIHHANKTLYNHDFDFRLLDTQEIQPVICIEDSGYTLVKNGNSSIFNLDDILYRLAVCFILAVIFTARKAYGRVKLAKKQRKRQIQAKLRKYSP